MRGIVLTGDSSFSGVINASVCLRRELVMMKQPKYKGDKAIANKVFVGIHQAYSLCGRFAVLLEVQLPLCSGPGCLYR